MFTGLLEILVDVLAGVSVAHFIDFQSAINTHLPGYPVGQDTTTGTMQNGIFGGFLLKKFIWAVILISLGIIIFRYIRKKLHIKL
jgi:uncharacterized membrane protein